MNTKIVWRLKERPTPQEIIDLKQAGLIKEDEARQILFSLETEEDRDKKSLESEIQFLRELVTKLSNGNNTKVVEIIHDVNKHYCNYPWYPSYYGWTNNANTAIQSYSSGTNELNTIAGTTSVSYDMQNSQANLTSQTSIPFSDIKTW